MKIIYQLHITVFDALSYDDNEEADKSGEELLYFILYLENSDKSRFADIKNFWERLYLKQGIIPKDCYCGTKPNFKLPT